MMGGRWQDGQTAHLDSIGYRYEACRSAFPLPFALA